MKFTATAPEAFKLPALLKDAEPELRRRAAGGTLEAAKLVEAVARATVPVANTQELRTRHGTRQIMANGWPGAEVVNTAPHAIVVHEGRRPMKRWPAPGVLRLWMRFKGIVDVLHEDTKYGEIEYLIARKIGRQGTKGRPWLKLAAESRREQITAIMRRWMQEGK